MKIDDKRGFTLIEILIVMMIVGVISAMAIGGYSATRRASLLDLAADSILSQIYELRETAIYGDFGSERYDEIKTALEEGEIPDDDKEDDEAGIVSGSQCLGLLISQNIETGEFVFGSFSDQFSGKRIYFGGEWSYQGCVTIETAFTLDFQTESFEVDELITVEKVVYNGEMEIQTLVMRFLPPEGELELSIDGRRFETDFDEDFLEITIRYGEGDDDNLRRKIVYDLSSNKGFISRLD